MSESEVFVGSQEEREKTSFKGVVYRLLRPSGDNIFEVISAILACTAVVIIALAGTVLARGSFPAFSKFGLGFITGVDWNNSVGQVAYGVLPYILGTLVTSAIALAIGIPVSLGIAIFLAEMAPASVRIPLSQLVELLAAVPSVIYGLWALLILSPWIAANVETPIIKNFGYIPIFRGSPNGLDVFMAGLILAVMVIPTVSSISKEVMMAVPSSQREAAYSIGATRWEVVRIGVLSYSRSGVFGASILGLGRAVGETMAVFMIIGGATGSAAIPTSLFIPGQTLASLIAGQYYEADGLQLAALVGAGLVLFGLALVINILAQFLVWRVLKVNAGAVE